MSNTDQHGARSTAPTPADIQTTAALIRPYVRNTPVWDLMDTSLNELLDASIFLKLELLQKTGTFKPRGALSVMLRLTPDELARGVTAVSGGNHAIAVSYAAQALGTTAKVVMPKAASPVRIARSRAYGAEVVLAENIQEAFALVEHIRAEEHRTLVHPFEGFFTACGTATVGAEFLAAVPDLDVVIVSVGGGGLIAGVSAAIKQQNPLCRVIGVEPIGASSMYQSFQSGEPVSLPALDTIADSLSAPYALPYSFGVCRQFVDDIVLVSDNQIKDAMRLGVEELKLALEPAAAAPFAALAGPLSQYARQKRIGVVVCGSNIDADRFAALTRTG